MSACPLDGSSISLDRYVSLTKDLLEQRSSELLVLEQRRDTPKRVRPSERGHRLLDEGTQDEQSTRSARAHNVARGGDDGRTWAMLMDFLTIPVAWDLTWSVVLWEDWAWDMMRWG